MLWMLGLLVGGQAQAQTWRDFEAAVPAFPCQDGFAACVQNGERLEPVLRPTAGALPGPADLRLDWFALTPTAAFVPLERAPRYAGSTFDPSRLATPPPSAPQPPPARAVAPPTRDVPRIAGPDATPTAIAPPQPPQPPPPPEDPRSTDACEALAPLESAALLGRLGAVTRSCLEERLSTAARQTERARISSVLMADAFAAGELARWEALAAAHLRTIDASDPDLCFKYALHLARTDRHAEVIAWADVALENRARWTGALHVERVSALHKLRTRAALGLWHAAEREHAATPDGATSERTAAARARAKTAAREWLAYVRAAGLDDRVALEACESAAGARDFCTPG